jgi:CRP-like cAMP-binding protein/adenosine deaminase
MKILCKFLAFYHEYMTEDQSLFKGVLMAGVPKIIQSPGVGSGNKFVSAGKIGGINLAFTPFISSRPEISLVGGNISFDYIINPLLLAESSSSNVRVRTFHAGETIVSSGTPPGELYFIVSGKAKIVLATTEGEHFIASSGSNDVIGEISWLTGINRTANVIATEETKVVSVDGEFFRSWLSETGHDGKFYSDVASLVYTRLDHQFKVKIAGKTVEGLIYDDDIEKQEGEAYSPDENRVQISADHLIEAYNKKGSNGIAEELHKFFIEQAILGDPKGLMAWMDLLAKKSKTPVRDLEVIFSYIPSGQLHIHPTRSIPTWYTIKLGLSCLADGKAFDWTEANRATRPLVELIRSNPACKNKFKAYKELKFLTFDEAEGVWEYQLQNILACLKSESDPNFLLAKHLLLGLLIYFGHRDLLEYLSVGGWVSKLFRNAKDIEDAARAIGMREFYGGNRILELRFSPLKQGMTFWEVMEAYRRGLKKEMKKSKGKFDAKIIVEWNTTMPTEEDVTVEGGSNHELAVDENSWTPMDQARALVDYVRDLPPEERGMIIALDTCGPEIINRGKNKNLASGARFGKPNEFFSDPMKYREAFNYVREKLRDLPGGGVDVRLTVHAGENFITIEQGLYNVAASIDMGANRIGHGLILGTKFENDKIRKRIKEEYGLKLRAENPDMPAEELNDRVEKGWEGYLKELEKWRNSVLHFMARERIAIEACPMSNTQTSDLTTTSHPARDFDAEDVPYSFSTDNSTTSGTSALLEVVRMALDNKLSLMDAIRIRINGYRLRMENLPSRFHGSDKDLREEISKAVIAGRDINKAMADIIAETFGHGQTAAFYFSRAEEGKYRLNYTTSALGRRFNGKEFEEFRRLAEEQGLSFSKGTKISLSSDPDAGFVFVYSTNKKFANLDVKEITESIDHAKKFKAYFDNADNAKDGEWYLGRSLANFFNRAEQRLGSRLNLLLLNLVGVNNDNGFFSHEIKNEFLSKLITQKIEEYFKWLNIDVTVNCDGSAFIIELPEGVGNGILNNVQNGLKSLVRNALIKLENGSEIGFGDVRTRAVKYDGRTEQLTIREIMNAVIHQMFIVDRMWEPDLESIPVNLIKIDPFTEPDARALGPLNLMIARTRAAFGEEKKKIEKLNGKKK